MTKEQEARIKLLEDFIKIDFSNPMGWTGYYDTELKELSNAIETVLNMLKEKDNLINEQLKENVKLQKELNEENKRCMILANNDKFKEQVIDLMARAIDNYDSQLVINTFKDKEHVKQYFERESKECQDIENSIILEKGEKNVKNKR